MSKIASKRRADPQIGDIGHIFPGVNDLQAQQLRQFCELVEAWNRRINLVSQQDAARLWERHLLPSIIPLRFVEIPPESWILDVGSGGGFPAIPLKILRPDLQMLLVDSVRKKTLFLQKAISDLGLEKIAVANRRVEELANRAELRERFDLITARAVGAIELLLDWGEPFLKSGGFWLLWKGGSDVAELEELARRRKLDYRVLSVPESLQALSPRFKELRWFKISKQ